MNINFLAPLNKVGYGVCGVGILSALRAAGHRVALWPLGPIDVEQVVEQTDDELEWAFVHELAHVFLNEMRQEDDAAAHEERCASQLADAFIWLRESVEAETRKKK